MRVLLVEDNTELVSLLKKGLSQSGFSADSVGTVGDAAHVLATMQYAAIVLDLGLPDEDGLTLLRDMRRRGDSTPVLVLTARDGVSDRVTGLREGADDYLAKPFAMEELVARLQALLRRPGNLLGQLLTFGNVALDTEGRQVFVDGTARPSRRARRRCWRSCCGAAATWRPSACSRTSCSACRAMSARTPSKSTSTACARCWPMPAPR